MKKVISTFLSLAILFTLSSPVLATESTTINSQVSYLLNNGFPLELLNALDSKKINSFYEELINGNIICGTPNVSYLYEDVNPSVLPYSAIPEADMALCVWHVIHINPNSDVAKIRTIEIFIQYEWAENKPKIRKEDGISVNWDSDLFYASNFYAESISYTKGLGETVLLELNTPSSELDQGGLGYFAAVDGVGDIYGTASFHLVPRSPIYMGSYYNTVVNVKYVHSKELLGSTITFVKGPVGIGINCKGANDSTTGYTEFNFSK